MAVAKIMIVSRHAPLRPAPTDIRYIPTYKFISSLRDIGNIAQATTVCKLY